MRPITSLQLQAAAHWAKQDLAVLIQLRARFHRAAVLPTSAYERNQRSTLWLQLDLIDAELKTRGLRKDHAN